MNIHVQPGSVVVGVDGSTAGLDAVVVAAAHAADGHRTLVIVHASGHVGRRSSASEQARRIAGERCVSRALEVAHHARPGVQIDTVVLPSDPVELLVELSTTAELVVVGSRGRGPLETMVLGSVSAAVASVAKAPVVVARPPRHTRPAGWVVVGTDGTEKSAAALAFAFRYASRWSRPLTVVHAVKERTTSETGDIPVDRLPRYHEEISALAEAVSGLRATYPDAVPELRIVGGSAAKYLARVSDHAELVVVGSGRQHGRAGAVLGSVSQAVAELGRCSVAVVHDPVTFGHGPTRAPVAAGVVALRRSE